MAAGRHPCLVNGTYLSDGRGTTAGPPPIPKEYEWSGYQNANCVWNQIAESAVSLAGYRLS
jgi:hypothetical protein